LFISVTRYLNKRSKIVLLPAVMDSAVFVMASAVLWIEDGTLAEWMHDENYDD
jgi:hypothetical protein